MIDPEPAGPDAVREALTAGLPGVPTLPVLAPLPRFPVRIDPPDLSAWRNGNTGVEGVFVLDSGVRGPHVGLSALMHGNEFAGAIVLDELLRSGFRPLRGRLTLALLNVSAFARFDPANPTASRFVDEDMNRLWEPAILDGRRHSRELDRARAVRPLLDRAETLLDLHSMLWPSEPLILSGPTEAARRFALTLGTPPLVVSDAGHTSGPRLIDYVPATDPSGRRRALLVEAGPHWEPRTVEATRDAVRTLLERTGLAAPPVLPPDAPATSRPPARSARVTHVVTAATGAFGFVRPFRGGEVIPERDTLIAWDGTSEIRTPHDQCLLVMPSLRPSRGHTAVRLARLVPDP